MSLINHKIKVLHKCGHWQRWKILSVARVEDVSCYHFKLYGPVEGTYLYRDSYSGIYYFWVTKTDRVRTMQKRNCSACTAGSTPRFGPFLTYQRQRKIEYSRLEKNIEITNHEVLEIFKKADNKHQLIHMFRLLKKNHAWNLLVFDLSILHFLYEKNFVH